jgi:hypothetical protein
MDFLLIVLGIGGIVFAVVMLVLASRATRMERESDARVQTLQTLATGSVLFAAGGLVESDEPLPLRLQSHEVDLDLAWDEPPAGRDERAEAPAYPFVLTVPAAAREGRVFSFERTPRRSQT